MQLQIALYNTNLAPRYVAPHPSEVIDQVFGKQNNLGGLFISGIEGANNHVLLNRLDITSVLTVGSDIQNTRFPAPLDHKIILILDYPDQQISQFFQEAIDFIQNSISKGRSVLVHCHLGVSRSATIILAYLISVCRMGLNESYKHMRKIRPLVCPNDGFLLQLYNYYILIRQDERKRMSVVQIRNRSTQQCQRISMISTNKSQKSSVNQKVKIQAVFGKAFNERSMKPLKQISRNRGVVQY